MSAHILYELTSLQSISWLLIPPLFCRFDLSDFKRLEPYAGKLARTVLRGGVASNGRSLPDNQPVIRPLKNKGPASCGAFAFKGSSQARSDRWWRGWNVCRVATIKARVVASRLSLVA